LPGQPDTGISDNICVRTPGQIKAVIAGQ